MINYAYRNVCLTLDDGDQLCTPKNYGFDVMSDSPPYEIDFIFPRDHVRKLHLKFYDNAFVSDLQIFYTEKYSPWSEWSNCVVSSTNGDSIRTRTRTCLDGVTCTDPLSEQDTCK